MRPALPAWLTALALVVAPSAFADCVDFSQKRADAAGAALARNAPSAAQLGVPSLDGLTLDGPLTTGDPKCEKPGPPRRFIYNTSLSFGELVTRWHPYIKRRTEVDGMKREWFKNPYHANGFDLTSGTRVEFVLGPGQQITRMFIAPASTVAALTTESQPYGVSEIVDWSPWPGGAKGSRQFVRADQGSGAAAIPSAASSPAAADPATGAPVAAAPAAKPVANVNCPPKPASGGNDAARAGADIGGAVLGGGFGRSLGNAVGGVLGSLGGSPQAAPPADPNCP
jgi:hypothetical protein